MTIRNVIKISLLFLSSVAYSQQIKGVYKINDLLKRIDNQDTVYVVNFWAVWCKPCIQEIPSFDTLTFKTKQQPIKVLLMSIDFKEDADEKVNSFLKNKNIKSDCILLNEINGNDYIDRVSKQWSGAIPATLFKKGNTKLLIEKKITVAEMEKHIATVSK